MGRSFAVGRLEAGRDRGSVFEVEESEAEAMELTAAEEEGVVVPNPNRDVEVSCSREAEGRRRIGLMSPEAAVAAPARLSFDCDGRSTGVLAVGKRDDGRGRPPSFP